MIERCDVFSHAVAKWLFANTLKIDMSQEGSIGEGRVREHKRQLKH